MRNQIICEINWGSQNLWLMQEVRMDYDTRQHMLANTNNECMLVNDIYVETDEKN